MVCNGEGEQVFFGDKLESCFDKKLNLELMSESEAKRGLITLSVTLHRDVLTWLIVKEKLGWFYDEIVKVRQYCLSTKSLKEIKI
jgi:hypothetical protein